MMQYLLTDPYNIIVFATKYCNYFRRAENGERTAAIQINQVGGI